MSKCDVTINKGLTINAGNYESLRPDVSVTFKDVDISRLDEFYKKADDFVCDLLVLSIASLKGVKSVVDDRSFDSVIEKVNENLGNELKDLCKIDIRI
jgi:hypothetical protein